MNCSAVRISDHREHHGHHCLTPVRGAARVGAARGRHGQPRGRHLRQVRHHHTCRREDLQQFGRDGHRGVSAQKSGKLSRNSFKRIAIFFKLDSYSWSFLEKIPYFFQKKMNQMCLEKGGP